LSEFILCCAEALNDIVQRNMVEIRKYGFGEELSDTEDVAWSGIQFWQVVKQLATSTTVRTAMFSVVWISCLLYYFNILLCPDKLRRIEMGSIFQRRG
jgi:hypothetical protein